MTGGNTVVIILFSMAFTAGWKPPPPSLPLLCSLQKDAYLSRQEKAEVIYRHCELAKQSIIAEYQCFAKLVIGRYEAILKS